MITDVNVNLSRWPFRRLPNDEPAQLVRKLRDRGITQAWACSFDGLLHKDLSAVNQRISEECSTYGKDLLLPVGAINPMLPDWKTDVLRCREVHGMKVIRLFPNYHGYELSDPVVPELFDLAQSSELIVQIALKMEDERTHHPLMQVPEVKTEPLKEVLKDFPDLAIVLLNGLKSLRGNALSELIRSGNVYVEISMLEGVGGIEKILALVPVERLLFGSHFPFFYLESALLKLQESELGNFRLKAITQDNAAKLLS